MSPLSWHGLVRQFQSEVIQIRLFMGERQASVTLVGNGERLHRDLRPLPALTETGGPPSGWQRKKVVFWPRVPHLRSHLLCRVPDEGRCCFPLGAIVKFAFHPGLRVSWGHECGRSTQPPLFSSAEVQKNKCQPGYFSEKNVSLCAELQGFPTKPMFYLRMTLNRTGLRRMNSRKIALSFLSSQVFPTTFVTNL